MTDVTGELQELAAAYGVATDYWDWRGNHVAPSAETVVAVLEAMGVDASTPSVAAQALHEHQRARWTRMLPPCIVTRQGSTPRFDVHVDHGQRADVWVQLEDGSSRGGFPQLENWTPPQEIDGRLIGAASFAVPGDLPLGYHTLRAWSEGRDAATALIVTPVWLGFPDRMGSERGWGLATQLYSVRSEQSWGVGDLADLADLATWSGADLGADFVLVNPLHAAEPVAPMEPSPYLPTTRRFANPIYLRVERIPEYAYLAAEQRAAVDRLRDAVHKDLDSLDVIDRDTVWAAKQEALRLVHAVPRSAGREVAYQAYRRREGGGLDSFATWSALAEAHGSVWHNWSDELQHPDSPAVAAFLTEHPEAVDFHRWLQWMLDEQLGTAQSAAHGVGMSLGVVHDLAVGVHPAGADAWSLQDALAKNINVGAPPDPFNQIGQDWSQPPWRPDRLAELAYAPFRELIATVLRHAGGVRVDHIIGLFRLWWIPSGQAPTEGAYVRYDHEAMIGILALEAQRAEALVVGEDLGTVEPWVRDYLRERGILGTSILWFEFDDAGRPLAPESWREFCLASVTTHDLPPTAGYLDGDHVRLRDELGLLARSLDDELAAAAAERGAWLKELRERGLLAADADVEHTVAALHRFLTWTPSRLLCVALTDMVGDRRTQNQPGTTNEYPNWRVPLSGPDGRPMTLENVFTSTRAAALARLLGA